MDGLLAYFLLFKGIGRADRHDPVSFSQALAALREISLPPGNNVPGSSK